MAVQKRKPNKQQQKTAEASVEVNKPVELNPKTTHYEFGGPVGAVGMVVILPILVLFFATCCDETGYPSQAFRDDWKATILSKLTKDFLISLYDPSAFAIYFAFVGILAFFYIVLPGDHIPGTVLRDGTKFKYRMNGFASFHTLLFGALFFLKDTGPKPLEYVYNHFVGLAFASIIFSYIVSIYVYLASFKPGKLLALGGNTGNPIYDVSWILKFIFINATKKFTDSQF